MQKLEGLQIGNSIFRLVPGSDPIDSTFKTIYRMTDGQRDIAAKVFKDEEDLTMSVEDDVEAEIDATKKLKTSPLGIYIPEFIYRIIDENNRSIGLCVNWEDGVSLEKMKPQQPLTSPELDRFEGAFLATIEMGYLPCIDLISPWNIMFNQQRSTRIWLAECEIETEELNMGKYYIEYYDDAMESLRKFVKK